jgi:hypothetical protein
VPERMREIAEAAVKHIHQLADPDDEGACCSCFFLLLSPLSLLYLFVSLYLSLSLSCSLLPFALSLLSVDCSFVSLFPPS